MGKFKIVTHSVILATTLSFLNYPQDALRQADFHVQEIHSRLPKNIRKTKRYHLVSYDDILNLLEEIESNTTDYREKDLRRINRFLTYLANEGVLPNSDNALALRNDIEDLLEVNDYTFIDLEDEYTIIPAVGNGAADILLCKSKLSKKWKKTKKFIKKHKKEIIIGAIIVVATATIVVAVVAISASGAAARAAGAAGAASSSKSGRKEKSSPVQAEDSDSFPFDDTCNIVEAIKETPTVKAVVTEQVNELKEFLIEDQVAQHSSPSQEWNDLSFGEKARELGAHLAHQAYEEITELVCVVPQFCEEIKDLGSKLLPEDLTPPNNELSRDPKDNFENLVAKGHKTIDTFFTTDQADLFSAEAKANDSTNNFSIGMIPIPGMISSSGAINVQGFSKLGRVADRAGFTKAGRGLMKHGYREGSAFPKPVGNPSQVNQHGQQVLESILKHPEKKVVQYTHKFHGPVIEIEIPHIGGVRFNGDGTEMMGFLEPRRFTNNP